MSHVNKDIPTSFLVSVRQLVGSQILESEDEKQIVIKARPDDRGRIVDLSHPTEQQLSAWSERAIKDAAILDGRASDLERQASELLTRALEARKSAKTLRVRVDDKSILPTSNMCRVCVSKPVAAGWGMLMTNCGDCRVKPIHAYPTPPFHHRQAE